MSNTSKNSGTKAFILSLSKIITLLLSTITSMILSRTLELDENGTYAELLTVSSIAVSVFSLGLPNALNYFLPRSKDEQEKRRFINLYFVLISVLSLVLMGAMALANRPIAAYYHNDRIIAYSYFIIIVPWTKLIISSRSNLLIAEGMVLREIIYSVLNGLFLTLIAVFTVFFQNFFDVYIALYVVVECVFAALVYVEAFLRTGKSISLRLNAEWIKELLVYSIPLGLSTAVSTINLDLDKLIIGFMMDEASVAIYNNAGKELPFSLISASFSAVFLPLIILYVKNNKKQEAVDRWKDIMEINYILLAFCVAASIAFAPQIVSFLYSAKYLAGVNIFRIYSLTLLLRITYWGMILNAFGRTQEILLNSVICLVLNVILNVAFYFAFGFTGPAIATLISIFAIVILQIVRTSKLLKMPSRSFIPYTRFLLPTVISAASGLGVGIAVERCGVGTDGKGIITVAVIGVIWGAVYLIVFGKRILGLWRSLNLEVKETNKE